MNSITRWSTRPTPPLLQRLSAHVGACRSPNADVIPRVRSHQPDPNEVTPTPHRKDHRLGVRGFFVLGCKAFSVEGCHRLRGYPGCGHYNRLTPW